MIKPKRPPEEWRMITDAGRSRYGWYEVSNHGRFRHIYGVKPPRILTPYRKNSVKHGSDYYLIKFCGKERRVSHVVWEAFNGPIPDGYRVVHVVSDKRDNALWNLKLMRAEELGRNFGRMADKNGSRRTIARVDREGNIVEVYRSSRHASRVYGMMSYQAILDRCNGKIKREGDKYLPDGTTFMWEDEVSG